MSLRNVLGHAREADQIRAALFGDRPGSSYLFSGPDGVGKSHFAWQVAKMLFCETGEGDACDACKTCRQVEHDNHPDFHFVQASEGKRFVSLEQVQDVCGRYSLRPHGERRIAVLRDADAMTTEAANALLKTLEEPPAWGLLLLTTSRPDALPETILSRCQVLHFDPLGRDDIATILRNRCEWPPEAVQFAVGMADGSAGRALMLLEAGGLELRDDLLGRLRRLRSQHNFELARHVLDFAGEGARNLEDRRVALRLVLQIMVRYYRDVWLLQLGGGPAQLFHRDRVDEVRADAERLGVGIPEKALTLLLEGWSRVNRNVNMGLLLESVFFRLGLLVQD